MGFIPNSGKLLAGVSKTLGGCVSVLHDTPSAPLQRVQSLCSSSCRMLSFYQGTASGVQCRSPRVCAPCYILLSRKLGGQWSVLLVSERTCVAPEAGARPRSPWTARWWCLVTATQLALEAVVFTCDHRLAWHLGGT